MLAKHSSNTVYMYTDQVMRLLSSLCVCRGVAMRDKQRHIFKHLLACKDLLLHTSLKDRVHRSGFIGH